MDKKPPFVVWISDTLKCLSFHQESKFTAMDFRNHMEMWQKVHELIDKGYVVQ